MKILTSAALIIIGFAFHASAQEEHSHDGEVGRFYEQWLVPGVIPRVTSCCSRRDCDIVEHVRWVDGVLMMQRRKDGAWLTVPREKIESNFEDARDSPDGQSHMCSRGGAVYCAVLGSGI